MGKGLARVLVKTALDRLGKPPYDRECKKGSAGRGLKKAGTPARTKGMYADVRMRKKKWAEPELNDCPYFVKDPAAQRGRWQEWFARRQPIRLELGCGKGTFASVSAFEHPEINFIAIDLISDILGVARRNIADLFGDRPVENLALAAWDIERITQIFAPEDTVERIYINFCNPWPRGKHHKKRLTHTRQLELYKTFLQDGGEIHFKTDDDLLFAESLGYLAQSGGFEVTYETRDLHGSGYPGNIMTEHERMFSDQGIPIKFLIARYRKVL